MVGITVVIQSLLQLTALATEVAAVVKRIQNGEEISQEEWNELRNRVKKANEDWESS